MMVMSVPYEATGRTGQKSRTRQALVESARKLLAEGLTPRVEDAAADAGISRTTAYRYFTNQRALLLAAQPQIQPDSLLGPDAPTDPRARLDAFMRAFAEYNREWEQQLRSALRLSLEARPERPLLRRGRAIMWIEDALAPLELTHPAVDRRALAVAIRSATGIETLIWLLDIAGQSWAQAAETVRRTARALLEAALHEHPEQ
ncbi:TetR/AcrR family transcriptional regulator [Dactylosporangium matsuzakiense]|uniref:TetR family transcriptional regulator n=2 Tax=Dactylosporangium matsuzakiense TaxID=53360 RepID=A0A9W6KTB5_9ACTN|nr:TetR family transcriptional regulator [Dactylosporangium matsuzakiense]